MDCLDFVSVKFSSQNVTKNLINEIWPQKVIGIGVNIFNDVKLNITHIHTKKISIIEHLDWLTQFVTAAAATLKK